MDITEIKKTIGSIFDDGICNKVMTRSEKHLIDNVYFKNSSVGNNATNGVVCVNENEYMKYVLSKMAESKYELLPVTNDSKSVIGTIDNKDLNKLYSGCTGCDQRNACGVKSRVAKAVMNYSFVCAYQQDNMSSAIGKMKSNNMPSILVLDNDRDKKVFGMLTKTRILHRLADILFSFIEEKEKEKIMGNPYFQMLKKRAEECGDINIYGDETEIKYTPNNMINDIVQGTEKGRFFRRILVRNHEKDRKGQ